MSLAKTFLAELQQEAENTRKILSAITDDILEYKPDHKSWNTAQLASHIVEGYYWYVPTFRSNMIDFATMHYDKGDSTSIQSILEKFEQNLKLAIDCLQEVTNDAVFDEMWYMKAGDQDLGSMPRGEVVRLMLMNHLYHHRGQLTVYIRAAGNKLPGIYGPSQDEE